MSKERNQWNQENDAAVNSPGDSTNDSSQKESTISEGEDLKRNVEDSYDESQAKKD